MSDPTPLTDVLPFLRHRATCHLQAVRDNAPWDDLCTCGLREWWLATRSAPSLDVEALQVVPINDGEWHHHVYENGNVYIDGEALFRATAPAARSAPSLLTPENASAMGVALSKAWALSGRPSLLVEQDEWDGFGATLIAVLTERQP